MQLWMTLALAEAYERERDRLGDAGADMYCDADWAEVVLNNLRIWDPNLVRQFIDEVLS